MGSRTVDRNPSAIYLSRWMLIERYIERSIHRDSFTNRNELRSRSSRLGDFPPFPDEYSICPTGYLSLRRLIARLRSRHLPAEARFVVVVNLHRAPSVHRFPFKRAVCLLAVNQRR